MNGQIQPCSFYDTVGRELFALSVARLEEIPASIALPSQHFIVLLACDTRNIDPVTISKAAESLLKSGAIYVCCFGPDCERVHDIFDEVITLNEISSSLPPESVIMTTWHSNETLDEALFFFIFCAAPTAMFVDSCRAALAISVGNNDWYEKIVAALKDPKIIPY